MLMLLDASTSAGGTTTATGGMTNWVFWIMLVLVVVVFYFLVIRPQKKQEKEQNDMKNSLQVGDEITTIGGIQGKISQIKDDSIVIDVASVAGTEKVKLEIQKWAIGSVDSQDDSAAD